MIKTVSLETAKLLKENGFKWEVEYHWVHFKAKKTVMEAKIDNWKCVTRDWDTDESGYPDPTTDEILEELPERHKNGWLTTQKVGLWEVGYEANDITALSFEHKELCEALALLWLYLKKEGLLNANNHMAKNNHK